MAIATTSLGATLRIWRDRMTPAQVGLPAGYQRRAAGLRREELADLAGVSVDYVVRLEQGRATTPSAQVVAALARALQLTRAERDHLYSLAGLQPPGDTMICDHITPGLQRLLTRLGETAGAAVFAADWRMITWNRTWAALIGDPSVLHPDARNFVRSRFPVGDEETLGAWPVISDNAEETDRALVADLRAASARYPEDRRLAALLRRTLEGNERFAELWRAGAVGHHAEDSKTIAHPEVGDIHVNCDVLSANDNDLKIVLLTVQPDSEDASKLELARMSISR